MATLGRHSSISTDRVLSSIGGSATGVVTTLLVLLSLTFSLLSSARAGDVPIVRIGIDTKAESVEIGSESVWTIGVHHSRELRPARIDPSKAWTLEFAPTPARTVVVDENDRVRGSVTDTIFVFTDKKDEFIEVNGDRYRGELLIWPTENGLTVANVLDLESYLLGVVPLEMGAQTPERFEAIKAQTVAARSYTLNKLGRTRRGFDLFDTVSDQVYGGVAAEKQRCTEAVEQTEGVVAVYGGEPILALYSSTSGGHTASPDEIWGASDKDLPYLKGTRDKTGRVKESFCKDSPLYVWEEVWSGSEFEGMLDRNLPERVPGWNREQYGRLVDMKIVERSASKRVRRLALIFERDQVELEGDAIRWAIRRPNGSGLRSTLIEKVGVKRRSGQAEKIGMRGRGYGHGVGLCQFGAMGMSEVGYDYSQILRFYYRGVELRRFY